MAKDYSQMSRTELIRKIEELEEVVRILKGVVLHEDKSIIEIIAPKKSLKRVK